LLAPGTHAAKLRDALRSTSGTLHSASGVSLQLVWNRPPLAKTDWLQILNPNAAGEMGGLVAPKSDEGGWELVS